MKSTLIPIVPVFVEWGGPKASLFPPFPNCIAAAIGTSLHADVAIETHEIAIHAEHVSKLVFKQCLKLRTSKSTGIINIELEVSHKREVMTLMADQVVCTSVVGDERVANDAARAIDTHPLDADINIIDATAFICEFVQI